MTITGFPSLERRKIARLIREAKPEFVVLVGSWARGTQSHETSDLDVLIGIPSHRRCPSSNRLQSICLSSDEVTQRALKADDLVLWCLRYGMPLSGRRRWEELKSRLLPGAPWPSSQRKFQLASRQLNYVEQLTGMGDAEAAHEELRIALGHLARGLLLGRGEFPLSRPEVPDQLRQAGIPRLASMLDDAATRPLSLIEIQELARGSRFLIDQESRKHPV